MQAPKDFQNTIYIIQNVAFRAAQRRHANVGKSFLQFAQVMAAQSKIVNQVRGAAPLIGAQLPGTPGKTPLQPEHIRSNAH
jgi:hypothetical protein